MYRYTSINLFHAYNLDLHIDYLHKLVYNGLRKQEHNNDFESGGLIMANKGYYNAAVLDRLGNAFNAAKNAVKNNEDLRVRFSGGNSKMGEVPSVSTLPFFTCPERCHNTCGVKCYAAKLANLRPNVRNAYAHNTAMAIYKPVEYWRQIDEFVKGQRFFRFHVSGDIMNAAYFQHMIDIANNNPHCDILCFTKRYEVVNTWIEQNGDIPENLHVLFSGWQGLTPENPYNLPETNVYTCDDDFNATWKTCGGNCFNCACRGLGCWQANAGDIIAFKMH